MALKTTIAKIKQTMSHLQFYVAKAGEQAMGQLQQYVTQAEEQFEVLNASAKEKERSASPETPDLSGSEQATANLKAKRKRTDPLGCKSSGD